MEPPTFRDSRPAPATVPTAEALDQYSARERRNHDGELTNNLHL